MICGDEGTSIRDGSDGSGTGEDAGRPGSLPQLNDHPPDSAIEEAKPDGQRTLRGSDRLWLAAIVATALCLRVIYILQLRACPFFAAEIMDPKYHDQWARAFAAGERFIDGPYFRAPLYPWILGIIYWVFGPGTLLPRLLQALLGSMSCGLLFLIGRQAFSRTVGIVAGFAAASYWMFLYFDAELLIVVLIVFLDLLLLWRLLRTGHRRCPGLWAVNGFILGVSATARPNILLFAPAVLVWLAVMHRPHWGRVLAYAASFVVACACPILPITVRNYVVGQDRVLISSQAGVNFYIGNNPQSDGMTAVVPGTPAEWWEGYYATIARAEQAAGRKLKPSEVSGYYWRQALGFIRRQPGEAAALMLEKLGFFWTHWEIANNKDIRFVTSTYTPMVRYLPLGFWIVGPLGCLGLLLALRDAGRLFPLWGFVVVYMVSVVVFFVSARYRMPVVAVLILLGAHAVCWCLRALRPPRWRALGLAAVVLLLVSPVVARVPRGADTSMAQGYTAAGLALAHQGRLADAQALLTESLRRWPGQVKTLYSLGLVTAKQGRYAQAQDWFQRVLEVDPNHAGARTGLAAALAAQGRFSLAIGQLENLLRSNPDHAPALANLGGVLIWQGRLDDGLRRLGRAIRIDPATTTTLLNTARQLAARRRFEDAIRLLRVGLGHRPDDVGILSLLATTLAVCPDQRLRNGPEALQLAERACRLSNGQHPEALDAAAAAQFAHGQVEAAIQSARRAMDLAVKQGKAQLAAEIRTHLRRYEANEANTLPP